MAALNPKPSDDTEGVDFIEAAVRNEDAGAEIFERADADAVVHTAAALPLWDDAKDHRVARDQGMLRIAKAALQQF
ncbi:hypothetical protein ATH50_0955 [Haloplanus aerogenes]|uniref:Uncharacterized protein n=1 Tax=Haloplanus aerogenes TaxID=660522 RepID=A0A3M0DW68_9EURY|nr:hypothetical protein ATH50_0955 [Haloplanus aerogenes]